MLRVGLRQHSRAWSCRSDAIKVGLHRSSSWTISSNALVMQQLQHVHHGRGKVAVATKAASGYWTIAEPYTHEVEIKKSQFIATAWPVKSASEALAHIAEASDPSATHNCWAFKVGGSARSNDDGEPGGTAGKPILGAIEGDGLEGVCVLVIRYFGGIKLGAGGLVRAYGGAARDCVRAAPKAFVKAQANLEVKTPFESLGTVYNMLAKHGATAGSEEYLANGRVQLVLTVDADQAEQLQQAIADATSGKVKPKLVSPDDD